MTFSPEAGDDPPRLHLVTDDEVLRRGVFLETARSLLRVGGSRVALHLRGGSHGGRAMWSLSEALATAAHDSGAWLVVNDRLDVALGCEAHAVQLGRGSIPAPAAAAVARGRLRIGVSVHDLDEARVAVQDGADFLVAGTLFGTPSHPGVEPKGVAWLAPVAALGKPVLGIGGVESSRIAAVRQAGAHGVAVIRAVWSAPDPRAAMESLLRELE